MSNDTTASPAQTDTVEGRHGQRLSLLDVAFNDVARRHGTLYKLATAVWISPIQQSDEDRFHTLLMDLLYQHETLSASLPPVNAELTVTAKEIGTLNITCCGKTGMNAHEVVGFIATETYFQLATTMSIEELFKRENCDRLKLYLPPLTEKTRGRMDTALRKLRHDELDELLTKIRSESTLTIERNLAVGDPKGIAGVAVEEDELGGAEAGGESQRESPKDPPAPDPPKPPSGATFKKQADLFRHWHDTEELGAAGIIDKWNAMSEDDRRKLVPNDLKMISAKPGKERTGARERVRKIINYKPKIAAS